jgi:hypothetical protein
MRITESSRKFMNDFPNRKLPIDYVAYPGKMDHASMLFPWVLRTCSPVSSQLWSASLYNSLKIKRRAPVILFRFSLAVFSALYW